MKITLFFLRQYCSEESPQNIEDKLTNSIFEGERCSDNIWQLSIPHNRDDLRNVFSIVCEIMTHEHIRTYSPLTTNYITTTGTNLATQEELVRCRELSHINHYKPKNNLECLLSSCGILYGCDTNYKSSRASISFNLATGFTREGYLGEDDMGRIFISTEPVRHYKIALGWLNYILYKKGNLESYTPSSIQRKELPFCLNDVKDILGLDLTPNQIEYALHENGIIKKKDKVQVPIYRKDLTSQQDILEVIAHHPYSIQQLENNLKKVQEISIESKVIPSEKNKCIKLKDSRQHLVSRGYIEAKTYGFCSEEDNKKWLSWSNKELKAIKLSNPMSHAQQYMRLSPLPKLYEVLIKNISRGIKACKIFEVGRCFYEADKKTQEISKLSGVTYCYGEDHSYYRSSSKALHYTLGDVINLLPYENELEPVKDGVIILHNKEVLGFIKSIEKNTTIFELTLSERGYLPKNIAVQFSDFPIANRDISIICSLKYSYKEVLQLLHSANIEEIEAFYLKDIYFKEQARILSFEVVFRSDDNTLTTDYVNSCMSRLELLGQSLKN